MEMRISIEQPNPHSTRRKTAGKFIRYLSFAFCYKSVFQKSKQQMLLIIVSTYRDVTKKQYSFSVYWQSYLRFT